LADDEEVYLMGTQTENTLYAHTKLLSPPHMLLKRLVSQFCNFKK